MTYHSNYSAGTGKTRSEVRFRRNQPEPIAIPNIIGLGPEVHNWEPAKIRISEHRDISIAGPLEVKRLGTYHDNIADIIRKAKEIKSDPQRFLRKSVRIFSTLSIPLEISSLEIVYANLRWPSPAEPKAVPGEQRTPPSSNAIAISSLDIPGTSTFGKT